ncbi:MAG: mercury(II) reductase [Gaiellaceae bacterium]
MARQRSEINGMTCEHCALKVEAALEQAGATGVFVDYRRGFAEFDDATIDVGQARAAVAAAGYELGRPLSIDGDGRPEPVASLTSADGNHDYDLAIIGAGAAGFAAAIQAVERGARVAMIEHGTVGGTCVNIGCVPSKAMLRAGEIYNFAGHNPHRGAPTSTGPVALGELVAQKDELVERMRQEKYCDLIDEYGWDLVKGHAEFADAETLLVDGEPLRARSYLVASGARPAVPPIEGLEETGYVTSTSGLELKELPKRLLVIGGNYIGLEMGQLYAHLGAEVVLFEMLERIAPFEEPEVAETLGEVLESEGLQLVTGAKVVRAGRDGDQKTLTVLVDGGEQVFRGDEILIAAGRRPNTDKLGLDRAGVTLGERGTITVDDTLRTTNPRVFAAGDVTPHPQFVYVAAAQGSTAARNAVTDGAGKLDYTSLPRVTFTHPQVAAVGLTDEQAQEQGLDCECRTLPLEYVPRAQVNLDTRGFVKIVAERESGRIVGATAVAENAGDVILAAVYAVELGLTVEDVSRIWCPYLTMSEGFKLAAQIFSRDVSKLSCCAA